VLPPLGVGGREWDNNAIVCGVDVVVKRYNNFTVATGAGGYAGRRDGHANGVDACTI
jgi:hypothetical protein